MKKIHGSASCSTRYLVQYFSDGRGALLSPIWHPWVFYFVCLHAAVSSLEYMQMPTPSITSVTPNAALQGWSTLSPKRTLVKLENATEVALQTGTDIVIAESPSVL